LFKTTKTKQYNLQGGSRLGAPPTPFEKTGTGKKKKRRKIEGEWGVLIWNLCVD